MRVGERIRDAGPAILAAPAALVLSMLGLALVGVSPVLALRALVEGAFGNRAALEETLLKTGPLLWTGLAVTLAFRCGAWNIGAEGQFLAGALGATALATRVAPDAPSWCLAPGVILAGAACGGGLAAIAGALRAARGVSEVIATLLLNFIAIQCVAWAVQGPLQEAAGAYPQSDLLPEAARLSAIGRVHAGVLLAAAAAVVVSWLLFRTPLGFRMRAVGLSPLASRFAGISAERQIVLSLSIAGALAGCAGAAEVSGVTGRLYEGLSPGYGYTAIAVALLARLHPIAVIPTALFFGALEAGASAMQRSAGVPAVSTQIVQGLVVLFSVGLVRTGRPRVRPATRAAA